MVRKYNRLSARKVASIKEEGWYPDGSGLYLRVDGKNGRYWVFRYVSPTKKKRRTMGLGSLRTVSLALAREIARQCRELVKKHIDPLTHRKEELKQAQTKQRLEISFREVALRFIELNEANWKNVKHRQQWRNTLETYAYPIFGSCPINEVDTDLIVQALEPIWLEKSETANRVRGRIENILDYAKTLGLRDGDNPARWRGHLKHSLPNIVRDETHWPALPYEDINVFLTHLRNRAQKAAAQNRPIMSHQSLEFLIFTAGRTGEVLGAKWDEIDMGNALWTIPKERMKKNREHMVPLSDSAMKILNSLLEVRNSDYVFQGHRPNNPPSNMVMLNLMRRMGYGKWVPHGFRSTFTDWASECQSVYPEEVYDMALAHKIKSKTKRAYRRRHLLEKRRGLMAMWERFCNTPHDDGVISIVDRPRQSANK